MAKNNTNYIALAIFTIFVVIVLVIFVKPKDEPSTALGRAVEDVADGVGDAAKELDPDRTPGEKFGDAVEDLGENIQDSTGN